MIKVNLLCISRDMVGDMATVRAEIMEDTKGYFRVVDTIEVDIVSGARIPSEELQTKVLEIYND